jgi:hypothetical protein
MAIAGHVSRRMLERTSGSGLFKGTTYQLPFSS